MRDSLLRQSEDQGEQAENDRTAHRMARGCGVALDAAVSYTVRPAMKPPALSISRSENPCRGRRAAGQARQRQAAGRRPVADADAQLALRAARPHHRPQPGRGHGRHQGDRRLARDRRHDAAARSRILRPDQGEMPAAASGDHAHRPSADAQPRHHRRLALPSRSGGGAGVGLRGA